MQQDSVLQRPLFGSMTGRPISETAHQGRLCREAELGEIIFMDLFLLYVAHKAVKICTLFQHFI